MLTAADVAAIHERARARSRRGRARPIPSLDRRGADDEDVHSFVERELVERIGDAGRRLHTGRSRNEQVSLDFRLYLRRRIPGSSARSARLVGALAQQAERAGEAVMPSYTHLRRAQPVLVAHVWLSHAAAFRRDVERFDVARDEADAMPLGSGADCRHRYDIDTAVARATARLLSRRRQQHRHVRRPRLRRVVSLRVRAGDGPPLAGWPRTSSSSRARSSAFFELADAVATGVEPDAAEEEPGSARARARQVRRAIGMLTGWLAAMKGLPLGYNKDLQEDKAARLRRRGHASRAARGVGRRSIAHADAAIRAAHGPRGVGTAAGDRGRRLPRRSRGLPFRTAHEVTGAMVRQLLAEGREFESLSLAEWRRFSELFGDDVRERVSAAASVAAKQTPQSTAPQAVQAALEETRAWVSGAVAAGE